MVASATGPARAELDRFAMLIVCPSCASTYTIDAERLGPLGRRVRCAACRKEWFVAVQGPLPPAAPEIEGPTSPLRETEPAITASARSEHPQRRIDPPSVAPPARRLLVGSRLAGALAAPIRRAPGAVAAIALCLCVAGAFLGRTAIVRQWPEAALLYAAAGLPINVRGLAFEAIRSELTMEAGKTILVVEGEIRNVTRSIRDVPLIALGVRGADGQTLYSWRIEPSRPTIEGGGSLAFRSRLAAPPAAGEEVIVRFADPERLAAAGETR